MLHWAFYVLGIELTMVGCIVYWILAYDQHESDEVSVHTHIICGIFALLDFWICGIPVNVYHVLYTMFSGATYFVFTGIYYATNKEIIYYYIDYDVNIGIAVGIIMAVVLIGIPLNHFLFYLQSKLKILLAFNLSRC